MSIRKPLALFCGEMERRLALHDADRGRRGWSQDRASDLVRRLKEELFELEAALIADANTVGQYVDHVTDEAADVANFAMMVADVVGLEARRPAPRAGR